MLQGSGGGVEFFFSPTFHYQSTGESTARYLCLDGELQLHVSALANGLAVDLLHVIDDEVSATVLNLRTLVGGADSDDGSTGSDTSADT